MTTKKVLGLDIGLSSIGWAIVELKESEDAKSPAREFAFESGKFSTRARAFFRPPNNPANRPPNRGARRARNAAFGQASGAPVADSAIAC